ncbi:MAG TPA: hypothetical protein VD906_12625 [Caulobacteraceae bacterium]|nr:hypothetical protein [Caulobacteraceae bacterium]
MAAIAISLALLLDVRSGSAAEVMTQGEFRAHFAAVVGKHYPDVSIQPEGDTHLQLRSPTGAHGRLNTAFPYREYVSDPAARDEIVERYAATLQAMFPNRPFEAPENLIVFVDSVAATAKGDGLVQPLAGDRVAYLALRVDKMMRTATNGDLSKLGLSRPQAWQRAAANMATMAPLRSGQLSTDGNADAVMGDNAFARLVADPTVCAGKDRRVFLMLAPGAYPVGDPNKPGSMGRFQKLVAAVAVKPDAISRTPITCASGRWEAVEGVG